MIPLGDLIRALRGVTTIPLIPFRNGRIDHDAHQKNITYLMQNNFLSDNLPRIISIAGTSLIHHVDRVQVRGLLQSTSQAMQGRGVLISSIVPNPLSEIEVTIEEHCTLTRTPDAFLIMPLAGVYNSQGLYEQLLRLGDKVGKKHGARLLFYHRNRRDHDYVVRLIRESEHFVGIKVGTAIDEVPSLVNDIGDSGHVIWGIGDRSTAAAELGTTGHTSGISVVYARAGDYINNAQRAKDYNTAYELEKRVNALEELRFVNGREYNYSAVLEAMMLSGFEDIDGGEGGPFNPRVPSTVSKKVKEAIEGLADLH